MPPIVSRNLPRLMALAALASLTAAPRVAGACGGFFCSNIVVDQNAERILFEVQEDGSIYTVVEINFTGSAEFSWVVPVPGTPELVVTPAQALTLLDGATLPIIVPPETYGEDDSDRALAGGEDSGDDDSDGGVWVEDLPQVGPYDPEVIHGTDAQEVVDWLQANGYVITDAMVPFVDVYIQEGLNFLGMKLAPGADAAQITPIEMHYVDDLPMIPLILTAVAAEPEMGFEVFIAADQRYGAVGYANLEIVEDLLQADPRTGETNYYEVLSWQADAVGGRAFFTEYAQPTAEAISRVQSMYLGLEGEEEARTWLVDVLGRHEYLTRLYTRMSNWEMSADPEFGPVDGADVSNIHDLSGRPPVYYDTEVVPPAPCGTTYCGVGSLCATTEAGVDGCVCAAGSAGRTINAPRLGSLGSKRTLHCQRDTFDLYDDGAGYDLGDPCGLVNCGTHGSCVALNGVGMCACDDGYAAINLSGSPTCSAVTATYEAEQLLWPGWTENRVCGACSAAGSSPRQGAAAVLLVLLIGTAAGRARRQRSSWRRP